MKLDSEHWRESREGQHQGNSWVQCEIINLIHSFILFLFSFYFSFSFLFLFFFYIEIVNN